MTRYELPNTAEVLQMGEPRENAVTIYAPASAAHFDVAKATVKSSLDEAGRLLKERGADHALQTAWSQRSAEVLDDPCWHRLSQSLAIFATPDSYEVFVLPNVLEHQLQVGKYFDLGQFVRAVVTPQNAYALTLSANGWNLWSATATEVATEMEVDADGLGDVAEATNRESARGRSHVRRLHGDEGNKTLLEAYAKQVAETVRNDLDREDPSGATPLFLFATDPLESMFRHIGVGRREIVVIPGGPDALKAAQIDEAIRAHLGGLNAQHASATVDTIADGTGRGVVATDLVDIARAAVTAAVDTLVYDFTVDILGRLDGDTGEVTYDDEGYDLLSRIALVVLSNGGRVVPVRSSEITAELWNGTAAAGLRHPLTR